MASHMFAALLELVCECSTISIEMISNSMFCLEPEFVELDIFDMKN